MTLEEKDIPRILENAKAIIEDGEGHKLERICTMLRKEIDHYDWVGFYIVESGRERELILGPYSGEPTEHTRISFGQGICGQAADTGRLFLIQDVSRETNYLSCSPEVRSEIVLPIFRSGELAGELDIDSHQLEPFTETDEKLLGEICVMAAPLL
ncbi:MAG: GAF domain-containing protein [Thermoplasmatota archaeon]